MSKHEGYWTTKEAVANGWWKPLLYRLRKSGQINAYQFARDNNNYWLISELEAIKRSPPAVRPSRRQTS